MKKVIALVLIVSFGSVHGVLAQEVADTEMVNATQAETMVQSTQDSVPVDAAQADQVVPDIQGSQTPLQDTANTQAAASSTVIEDTTNPETSTSTDAVMVPVVTATSTDTTASSTPDVAAPLADAASSSVAESNEIVVSTPALDVVAEKIETPEIAVVSEIPAQETASQEHSVIVTPPVEEQTKFSFALTGKHIAAHQKDSRGEVTQATVSTQLVPSVDNTNGAMSVSGQCSDAYYVILLYKNPDDYANNPSSYFLNRAYPCEKGSYSYSISDLPRTLEDGTYYLLVGQEGNTGTWTPITGLTEITIKKQ